jgi:hypothetical protein
MDQVEVKNTDLPPHIQKILTRAFMSMIFSPGKMKGNPVRSRLQIAISLEELKAIKLQQ